MKFFKKVLAFLPAALLLLFIVSAVVSAAQTYPPRWRLSGTEIRTINSSITDVCNSDGTACSVLGSAAGDVSKVGTPVDNQIGIWTGDGTIEGTTALTWDGAFLDIVGDLGATASRIVHGWFTDLTVTNPINGDITGNAGTVTTIAGLAPDTATTQAAQPNITSLGTLTGLTMSGDIDKTAGAWGIGASVGANNITLGGATSTVVVAGNLTVSGTTTTLDTTTLNVEAIGITLANVGSPTDITADGAGITVLGDTNKTILWDNADDTWHFNQGVTMSDASHFIFDDTPASTDTGTGIVSAHQVDVNSVGITSCLHIDTDGNFVEADADAVTTMPCTALALESGTGSKQVLWNGFITDTGWAWTVGAPLYVSTTVGTLTQTAPSATGDQVQVVGIATSATTVYFNPDFTLLEIL